LICVESGCVGSTFDFVEYTFDFVETRQSFNMSKSILSASLAQADRRRLSLYWFVHKISIISSKHFTFV